MRPLSKAFRIKKISNPPFGRMEDLKTFAFFAITILFAKCVVCFFTLKIKEI